MGRYCRICGRTRANERFSGRGHRDHICRDCQRRPKAERDRVDRLDELEGFLRQSNISDQNIARLTLLREHPDLAVRRLAELISTVAGISRHRRRRLPILVRQHWPIFLNLVGEFGGDYLADYIVSYHGGDSWLWSAVERAEQELGLAESRVDPNGADLPFDKVEESLQPATPPDDEGDNIPF